MFDISWSELIVVAIIGLLVVGPKELPTVIRTIRNIITKIKSVSHDLINSLDEDAQIRNIKDEFKTIIDMNGNPQRIYDVDELMDMMSDDTTPTEFDMKISKKDTEPHIDS